MNLLKYPENHGGRAPSRGWIRSAGLLAFLVCTGMPSVCHAVHNYIDLQIADGQFGNLLDAVVENRSGAFTVANLNDTDGDTIIDKDDTNVPGEVDLCKLVVRRPATDLGDNVTLTMPASAKLWLSSDKSAGPAPLSIPVSDLPKTYWLELTAPSAKKKDIAIWLHYKGVDDKVMATGIWLTRSDFRNTNATGLWGNCDNPARATFASELDSHFGTYYNPATPQGSIGVNVGFEFLCKPPDIDMVHRVVFDCTRQRSSRFFKTLANDPLTLVEDTDPNKRKDWPGSGLPPAPGGPDTPNDENETGADNDNLPDHGDHVYSLDYPGLVLSASTAEMTMKKTNFREYVRVRIHKDALPPGGTSGTEDHGSRCSDRTEWYEFLFVKRSPTGFNRHANSKVALGQLTNLDNPNVIPP